MESIISSNFDFDKVDTNINPHRISFNQLSYLQSIQMKIKAELDLLPEKEYTTVKHDAQVKVIMPQKSILEAEYFNDPEEQREMYLRMFVDNYEPHQNTQDYQSNPSARNLSESTFRRDSDQQNFHSTRQQDDLSSLNERVDIDEDGNSLHDVDFQLTKSEKSFKGKTLDKNKSLKSVSFAQKVVTRKDVHSIAQEIMHEKLLNIRDDIKDIFDKNNTVQSQIEGAYSCDNTKVLEVILEHILFHWDDIMEVLIDDLMEEEVFELNKIEEQKKRRDQELSERRPQKETKLADRSLYGKYHDYKSVDMRDILGIFDDYMQAEQSIRNRI